MTGSSRKFERFEFRKSGQTDEEKNGFDGWPALLQRKFTNGKKMK